MITVPASLRAALTRGSAGQRSWLAALPERVADLAARWGLAVLEPFEPGGTTAWVAPVLLTTGRWRALRADGADAVLKVGWVHPEARDEADLLAALGGDGAVEVYAHERDATTAALLLERCQPGTPLGSHPEAEQHEVITGLLRRCWRVPIGDDLPFRPLATMCDAWAEEAEAKLAARPGTPDGGLARTGLALFRDLPRNAPRSVLLCTDLHAGNVLSATRQPWLLIDPKPYVGDPHYDVLQHLLNCRASLRTDPLRLVAGVADRAGLAADRVQAWLFARCVLESPDTPALRPVARALAP